MLRAGFPARFASATTEQTLRDENAKILGKKGELTAILGGLGALAPEARKAVGGLANTLRREVEAAFADRLADIARQARERELAGPSPDLTLPGRVPAPVGHPHPISRVRDEIVDVLVSLGFAVHDGPEVELEENNFGASRRIPATDACGTAFGCASAMAAHSHASDIASHAHQQCSDSRSDDARAADGVHRSWRRLSA